MTALIAGVKMRVVLDYQRRAVKGTLVRKDMPNSGYVCIIIA